MSEPALNSPDAQDPQNKQPMSEPALNSPDAQDPQNKRPILSRLLTPPLNVAVSHEVLRWKGFNHKTKHKNLDEYFKISYLKKESIID